MAQQACAPVRRMSAAERLEQTRRDRLRLLRATLAQEGYEGTVRLIQEDGSFVIALSPEAGIEEERLRHDLSSRLTETVEETLGHARRLTDLAGIASERAQAIADAGGSLRDVPAWAYLCHPVARGVYAAMGVDMAGFIPRRTSLPAEAGMIRIVEFRIAVANQRVRRGDMTISVDADQDVARVRILGGSWPETIVEAMPGRAVGDILGLPGLERGTRAGDSAIGEVWAESGGGVGFTVACALEPLGTAPEGVDTGFLGEWERKHFV